MKQTQLAGALVALAVMVFVVTFTMNYIGSSRPPRGPVPDGKAARNLTFPVKVAGNVLAPLECETKVPGHTDFWFVNDHEEPLEIGLRGKNCTCADVQLFVPPPEYQPRAHSLQANTVAQLAAPLGPLAGMSAAAELQVIQDATSPQEITTQEALTVPPSAVGWVRMIWSGDKVGRQTLQAVVWTDRNEREQEARLEAYLLFHPPIHAQQELILGRVEKLPRTEMIKVWSATRPDFSLEARVVSPHLDPAASDPVTVGQPQKMTPEELRKLEENNSRTTGSAAVEGRVLCGYHVPVTLSPLSRDRSTPCDRGPFRRAVVITARDIEPIQVLFAGRVRGPITMAVDDESGQIDLGQFSSQVEKSQSVNLKADSADITLEFNRARTPKFLYGTVDRVSSPGGKAPWLWKLTVAVKPGEVSGTFPDPGNRYQDSAVYLNAFRPKQPTQAEIVSSTVWAWAGPRTTVADVNFALWVALSPTTTPTQALRIPVIGTVLDR